MPRCYVIRPVAFCCTDKSKSDTVCLSPFPGKPKNNVRLVKAMHKACDCFRDSKHVNRPTGKPKPSDLRVLFAANDAIQIWAKRSKERIPSRLRRCSSAQYAASVTHCPHSYSGLFARAFSMRASGFICALYVECLGDCATREQRVHRCTVFHSSY